MFHFYASYQPVRKLSGNRFKVLGHPVFGHGVARGPAEARHLMRELWAKTYPLNARSFLHECPTSIANFPYLYSTASMDEVKKQLEGHAAPAWFRPNQSVCVTPPAPAQPALLRLVLRKKVGQTAELQILKGDEQVGIQLVQHVKIEMGTDEVPYVTLKFLVNDLDIDVEDAQVATEEEMLSNIQEALASLPFLVDKKAEDMKDIFGRKAANELFVQLPGAHL